MANITRSSTASFDASTSMFAQNVSGLLAGEAILTGQPCYIHSDGTVRLANGTALNAAAVVRGFAAGGASTGQPVTLYGKGARFKFATGLTPGASYYVATTAGVLSDVATTGGTAPIAFAIDTTDIMVIA